MKTKILILRKNKGIKLLNYSNYFEKLQKIKDKELSLKDNVQFFLKRIEDRKNINAYNFVFNDEALSQANHVEKKIQSGDHGRLAGMVIAVKDVLAIKDQPLTCSSKILDNFKSVYDATCVKKLIEEDAIIIGKTNCDEFAMGSSNENSATGKVLNPVNEEYVPGGSSGGSAAAVADFLCDAALGTDTGGSIRQPAAFCGIYGLKPTYGRVSRYGLTAFASSFDSIGPMTRNVSDTALIMEVISGHDEMDSTSLDSEVPRFSNETDSKDKFKIGVPKEFFAQGLDEEIKKRINEIISDLKSNGHEIVDIELPNMEYSIATYYILTTAEASSNLARFDGARYGKRSENADSLLEMYTNSRSEGFGEEVKRRIMLGTYVLSAGYYDAYYKKAQKVRKIIKKDFDKAFSEVDLILTPTTPTPTFKIGDKTDDPLAMYLGDIYTTSANLCGIPGINIPVGSNQKGLPIGMQLMADQLEEEKLLKLSFQIEKNS